MQRFVQRWTFRLPDERNVGTRAPVVAHASAYVAFNYDRKGLSESTLFALDVATGLQRWSYTIPHVGNEPLVVDDVVFWSSFEGSVHAIDREGRLLWTSPGAGASLGVPVADGGNRLFVSEIAGGARYTWCFDQITGATLWRFMHGGHAFRLFHSDDRVYHTSVASTGPDDRTRCTLYSLSVMDGRVLWSAERDGYLFSPVVIDGGVHVCSHDKMYVHSADDGRRIGEIALGPERATRTLARCSRRDRLIAWGSQHHERQGDSLAAWTIAPVKRWFGGERIAATRLWSLDEPRGLCDAPIALSGEQLAYVTHDGVVKALSSATGERVLELKLKTKAATTGGLASSGDHLVVTHGRDVVLLAPGD